MPTIRCRLAFIAASALTIAVSTAAAQTPRYEKAPDARGCRALGPVLLWPLVDSAALGGSEVEVARLVFPPGWDSTGTGHRHGRVELLYILKGRLDHVVNDTSHLLDAGRIGIVRPGDRVRHRVVSAEPVELLAIWGPGGELGRILGDRASRCP
jgi:mannose-6-phosphate isomerase-like protein (cupin superfamily)